MWADAQPELLVHALKGTQLGSEALLGIYSHQATVFELPMR